MWKMLVIVSKKGAKGLMKLALMNSDKLDKPIHVKMYRDNTSQSTYMISYLLKNYFSQL